MRIVRDGAKFTAIGAVQIAVDSAAYIALTTLGVATPPANVCGRIVGALLGFWLNGCVTFAHREQPRLRWRLARYVALWVVLTVVSTVCLTVFGHHAGLKHTWWAKPVIEIALGLISFLICRHWVYQR